MHALRFLIRRFGRDQRANIAVIFALICVPLITAVGCAIDYSRASQIRSKLQTASDIASVGSIAKTSPAFIYAGTMTADGPIPVGVTDATNLFKGNMANVAGYTLKSVTAVVAKSNGTVTFSASIPTVFLGLIGHSTMTLGGVSTSTANMLLYVDFYLLLDNSPARTLPLAKTP